jgi:membrane fusion protein, multidrug efflux system
VRLILLIALLPLLGAGYLLWKYLESYESTDDAQVDGHIHPISARISGDVSDVLVDDEQIVKAGDPLVTIDARDYAVAVARSEADVADAEATSRGSRTNVPVTSRTTTSHLNQRNPGLRTTNPR